MFANGTFSPAELPAVGYTLVSYMLRSGGEPRFVDFVSQLEQGKKLTDALRSVYNADIPTLARGYAVYVETLPGARAAAKKMK